MTLPRLALSVIGDEIGPSLEEMISFAHEHGLKRLDMRTVDGRNLLGMKKDEIIRISRTLEKAGLTVPTFVSPLFKWPAAGKSTVAGKVDFAFDPKECPAEDIIDHAIEIAVILGAPHMRIFSYLRHRRFRPGDLTEGKAFIKLMSLASHYDISIQLENEPVCNIGNVAELRAFFDPKEEELRRRVRRLEEDMLALETVDGVMVEDRVEAEAEAEAKLKKRKKNWWIPGTRTGKPSFISGRSSTSPTPGRPANGRATTISPRLRRWSRRFISRTAIWRPTEPCRWATATCRGRPNSSACWAASRPSEVLASIETHCPQDSRNATARSIAGLRRIAAEIGVEIV